MRHICKSHDPTQIHAVVYTMTTCFHPYWLVGEKQLPRLSQQCALIYNGLGAQIKAEPKIPFNIPGVIKRSTLPLLSPPNQVQFTSRFLQIKFWRARGFSHLLHRLIVS